MYIENYLTFVFNNTKIIKYFSIFVSVLHFGIQFLENSKNNDFNKVKY